MSIKFPITKITTSQKYGYCYTLQEALQIKHNQMGKKVETEEITLSEFRVWVKAWYDPRWDIVRDTLTELHHVIKFVNKNNNPSNINIDGVIKIGL